MRNILIVLTACICFQGYSQNYFDIVNFSYTNTPQNDFEISDAKTNVEELVLEVNFPIVINEKTILLTGLFANTTNVHLDANIPSSNLNVLGLNFGINKTYSDAWSSVFMVYSKLAADKIKFSNDNLQIAFISLFTNTKRADLKYRYGIYANTEKYGLMLVPILGLYYVSKDKKFVADLNLPIIADINYKIGDKAWLGLRFDGLGTTYNLTKQDYSNNGAYVSRTSNEIVSYLRFRLSNSLYVNGKVGYAISRNYKVFDADDKIDFALTSIYFGDNRTQLNERFKDGALFKIELLYRLHFN